jgi:hypothetical protein
MVMGFDCKARGNVRVGSSPTVRISFFWPRAYFPLHTFVSHCHATNPHCHATNPIVQVS